MQWRVVSINFIFHNNQAAFLSRNVSDYFWLSENFVSPVLHAYRDKRLGAAKNHAVAVHDEIVDHVKFS